MYAPLRLTGLITVIFDNPKFCSVVDRVRGMAQYLMALTTTADQLQLHRFACLRCGTIPLKTDLAAGLIQGDSYHGGN